jgi:hypothetical protein
MIKYHCDGCGKELEKGDLRYTVKVDVRAAYDELEIGLLDLVRDHRAELEALIEQLKERDAQELEAGVFKRCEFDLCPSCQRAYIRDPLHFHPEQSGPAPEVDVDSLLRSLGILPEGKSPEAD